jgi:acyl carrier protein
MKEFLDRFIDFLSVTQKFDRERLSPMTSLRNDLEIDSLRMVEIVVATEKEFNIVIDDRDVAKLETIQDWAAYIGKSQG